VLRMVVATERIVLAQQLAQAMESPQEPLFAASKFSQTRGVASGHGAMGRWIGSRQAASDRLLQA